jgi:hypothetical protein
MCTKFDFHLINRYLKLNLGENVSVAHDTKCIKFWQIFPHKSVEQTQEKITCIRKDIEKIL